MRPASKSFLDHTQSSWHLISLTTLSRTTNDPRGESHRPLEFAALDLSGIVASLASSSSTSYPGLFFPRSLSKSPYLSLAYLLRHCNHAILTILSRLPPPNILYVL